MSETDLANELSVSRHIAAPVEVVWDVMVNRTGEWWCPVPWRAEVVEWDRRPGGRSTMTMYGPDGEVVPQDGISSPGTKAAGLPAPMRSSGICSQPGHL